MRYLPIIENNVQNKPYSSYYNIIEKLIIEQHKKYQEKNNPLVFGSNTINFIQAEPRLIDISKSEKIIVSMTSYPARILYVKLVLESLLNLNVPKELYKIILVLAIPEFPSKENNLPKDLLYYIVSNKDMIEILWYPKNIRSHKKLMPTLAKYPNNPILVADDDVIRPYWWLRMYIEDHITYPNDIIFGASSWYFAGLYKLVRFNQFTCKDSGDLNNLPNQIFKAAKPANGLGGTLYPIGTFTDKRFFDEELMMKLSPTSDESWQFCFNIIENKTIRQSSKIVDYSLYFLLGSQDIKSSLHKVNNYTEINNRLFEAFPEFKTNLNKRFKDIIIALTSHGKRVQYLEKTLNSLLDLTLKPTKIVLTLHEEDVPNLTDDVKKLIDSKKIELITCDLKIGPHTKYFYVMQKYRDYAIITVDDDHIYDRDLCESLWKSYVNHPNIISARRVHLIKYDLFNRLLPYNKWGYNFRLMLNESKDLFATGVGGVIYPPDILHITEANLPDIYKCLYADDIYLKYLENKKGIKTIWVKNDNTEGTRLTDKEILECSLYNENVLNTVSNRNDEYLKIFKL